LYDDIKDEMSTYLYGPSTYDTGFPVVVIYVPDLIWRVTVTPTVPGYKFSKYSLGFWATDISARSIKQMFEPNISLFSS